MKLTWAILASTAMAIACGGTGTGSNPLDQGSSSDPIAPGKGAVGDPIGIGQGGGSQGEGGSGTGGGAATGGGGAGGSGGGGSITCESACAACQLPIDQCVPACTAQEPTQEQLQCFQETCDPTQCTTTGTGGTGGGSGGVGGSGQCTPDFMACELGSECCSQSCIDGVCGTATGFGGTGGSPPVCKQAGEFCSIGTECCTGICEGTCF